MGKNLKKKKTGAAWNRPKSIKRYSRLHWQEG